MRIKFNENIQEPIFAFTIKDIKGNDITGTNTMLEKVKNNNGVIYLAYDNEKIV